MKKLTYREYLDKVYGCWIGKCIGGTIGASVEGQRKEHNFSFETAFPEKIPPNDDLDIQILWLEVLEKKGIYITSDDLADAWLKKCWYPFNEYGNFRRNYRLGIRPPISGSFNNEFFDTGMGCPIRSEIWGVICPGAPDIASEYAYMDGTLDHTDESINAEIMFSRIESEIFFENDLIKLMKRNLNIFSKNSRIKEGIIEAIDSYNEKVDWHTARKRILLKNNTFEACDALVNVPFTIMALLYGEGDFEKTLLIALNSGYDTDCTCATAGAILGIILGGEGIPLKWKEKIKDEFVIGIDVHRKDNKIFTLAKDTARVGITMVQKRIKDVIIKDVPKDFSPVPFIKPKEDIKIDINYKGLPSIGYGEKKKIEIIVSNNSRRSLVGNLKLVSNEDLKLSISELNNFKLPFSKSKLVHLSVVVKDNKLPYKNNIKVIFSSKNNESYSNEFGLAGASIWQVLGIFWEDWDNKIHKQSFPSKVFRHNIVDINKEYINEKEWDYDLHIKEMKSIFKEKAVINANTYVIPIEDFIKIKGEFCIYLLSNVISPVTKDVNLIIGNNDGFKIWVNEKLIGIVDEQNCWTPFNHYFVSRLNKGENRVVLKLLRRSDNLKFSLGFREYIEGKHFNCLDWCIDLSTKLR